VEDGVNGFVVPRGDASALSKAINKILSDERLRNKLAVNARKSAEDNYKIESIVNKIESYYYDIFNMRFAN